MTTLHPSTPTDFWVSTRAADPDTIEVIVGLLTRLLARSPQLRDERDAADQQHRRLEGVPLAVLEPVHEQLLALAAAVPVAGPDARGQHGVEDHREVAQQRFVVARDQPLRRALRGLHAVGLQVLHEPVARLRFVASSIASVRLISFVCKARDSSAPMPGLESRKSTNFLAASWFLPRFINSIAKFCWVENDSGCSTPDARSRASV